MQGEKWKLTSTIKRKCEKGNEVIIQAFEIKRIGMEVILPKKICQAVSAETSDSVILMAIEFHQVITCAHLSARSPPRRTDEEANE